MFYGTAVWDPWLIVAQIICLQCSFYLSLGVFMILFLGLRVPRLSLVYFFDYATLTTSTLTGWCVIASFLCASLAGAVHMIFLVERARKCLDFSATLYIIHLFFCILYGGWPSSMAWWVVNGTGLAVMALLAEYLCIKREQREIPMDRFHSRNPDYIRCVSVHPTLPYVLSSSDDMLIKFWDWEKGWICTQIFYGHYHYVMQTTLLVGTNHSYPLVLMVLLLRSLQSLLLLINVFWKQVWDYQTKSCVQTLEGHTHNVSVVCFHPELPIIITVSEEGTARLWHATTCM
ncbi:unnamed protein product [Brassica oleracea var. botrytis]